MIGLPVTIVSLLQTNGFSSTEILVFSKFIEGERMTVRQLSSKTGKGTGMIDRAVKKLLKRNLIARESVNGTPCYHLLPSDVLDMWMSKNLRRARHELEKKEYDMRSFILSISKRNSLPRVEHFEGRIVVAEALRIFIKNISRTHGAYLYFPFEGQDLDKPCLLRDIFLSECRNRRIQVKIITPKAETSEPVKLYDFPCIETSLLKSADFSVNFGKIITADKLACILDGGDRATFIYSPELALAERRTFECIWKGRGRDCSVSVHLDKTSGGIFQGLSSQSRTFKWRAGMAAVGVVIVIIGIVGLLDKAVI